MDLKDFAVFGQPPDYEMNSDRLRAFLTACSTSHKIAKGEAADALARTLVSDQPALHTQYFEFLTAWSSASGVKNQFAPSIRTFAHSITSMIGGGFQITDQKGARLVTSVNNLPVLTAKAIEDLTKVVGSPSGTSSPKKVRYAQEVVAIGIAAYVGELNAADNRDMLAPFNWFAHQIQRAVSKIALHEYLLTPPAELVDATAGVKDQITKLGETVSRIERSQSSLSALQGGIAKDVTDIGIKNEALAKQLAARSAEQAAKLKELSDKQSAKLKVIAAEVKAETTEVKKQHDAAWETMKSDQEDELASLRTSIQNFYKSMREEIGLDATRKLWGSRAFWAAVGFYVSGLVLVAFLCGLPVAAYYYQDDVAAMITRFGEAIPKLQDDKAGEVASSIAVLGRLALLSAPLGFVVWLIRLVVRYNTRSMMLMDDARQRLTMLDTYLFLIERDVASKEDRGTLLEAMFRRAPGHNADTADPPQMTNLFNYGQETKKPG